MTFSARLAVVALGSVLILGACGSEDDGAGGSGDSEGSGSLEVAAQDFQFSPNELSVEPGAEVTIAFSNEGEAPHTFTAPDVEVDVRLDPGGSEEIAFTAPDSGSVTWTCTIHSQMTGTISVGGGAAGSGGGDNDGDKSSGSDDPYDY